MPRSSSSRRKNKWQQAPRDLSASVAGMRTSRTLPDGTWSVQTVKGNDSGKAYVCPGCGRDVSAAASHIVAWRQDAPHGIEIGVESRRHWHHRCFDRFR
ncbi:MULTISPECIES: hypothetical protein [unclassified Brevibacterium]|uniref:hypothetical protein n=1 Tax=unclassified Brevibacterium TaxID=2614124 RepID=UPI001F0DAA1D|nr:hypothetical protein [Brevibacterium sp. S22]